MNLRRRQTRALLEAWLIQALFGKSRRAGQTGSGSLTPAVFSQGFLSWAFAALAFEGSSPRAFVAGSLAFVTVLATSALIGELDDERERPADRDFVGATPTLPRTVLFARWMREAIVALLFAGGIAVPPAILAGFKAHSLLVPPLFVLAATLASSSFAVLLGSVTRIVAAIAGGARGSAFSSIVRAAIFGGGFVALLLGLRAMLAGPETFPGGRALLEAVPTTWFADAILGRSVMAVVATMLFIVGSGALAMAVSGLRERPSSGARRRIRTLGRMVDVLVKDPVRRAVATFTLDMLVRERSFRLRALPLLGLPAAAVLLALRADVGRERLPAMMALIHQLPAAYLPFLLLFAPYAENARAAWIVSLRLVNPIESYRAGFEVSLSLLIVPVQVLLFAVHLSLQPWQPALATTLGAIGLAWALMPFVAATVRELAFSVDPDDLEVPSDFGPTIGFALAMTGLSFVLAAAVRRAGLAAGIALLVVGFVILVLRSRRRRVAAPGRPTLESTPVVSKDL
ncbi:MAG: hypothetical protein KDC95_16530 [Planctomycetes bacterium]|nr:hypothetical protein [Planctomycetota bacterium]